MPIATTTDDHRAIHEGGERSSTLRRASPWEIYFPTRIHEAADAVYVASFPKIIYFWPSLIAFLVCGFLQAFTEVAPVTIGWWALCTLGFNMLVVVKDFDQKKFVILLLAVLAIALGVWITNLKGIPLFQNLGHWFGSLEPTIGTHTCFLMAGILGVLFLWGLITTRFNYWRLEPNEFVHYVQPVGRDQSFPREQHTVTKEVPDVFEYLLTFGGGSLLIKYQNTVVARIEDVPFLSRRMSGIEEMLGVRRVRMVD